MLTVAIPDNGPSYTIRRRAKMSKTSEKYDLLYQQQLGLLVELIIHVDL